jgi:TRAP-type mannitol/chloroaromatic compound transport system permease small subunit
VTFLLRLSRLVDAANDRIGKVMYWAILLSVVVSAANATVRYSLNIGSNAWLELQWYLFSAVFLMCAGYTLLRNEHIRVDIIFGRLPERVQAWIDIVGGVLCLLPMAIIIMVLAWPVFVESYEINEWSQNAGGLLRWPVKLLLPVAFLLLTLQGLSEIIKRVAFLMGLIPYPGGKHSSHGAEEAHGK